MKPSLQIRLSQGLTLTPQLQQSIRLLQMSTLQLNEEIAQALADNPMLERADDLMSDALRIRADGSLVSRADRFGTGDGVSASTDAAGREPGDATAGDTDGASAMDTGYSAEDAPGSDYGDGGGEWSGSGTRSRGDGDDGEGDYPQLAGADESLREHLFAQVATTSASARDRALVELLIDELNDDGYLQSTPAELIEILPAELEVEETELVAALRLLQSFEPAGVGAIDLRECLLLQLGVRADSRLGQASNGADGTDACIGLARRIVEHHLDALAAKDYARIKRVLRCDDDTLKAAQALIRSLSPRPGAAYARNAATYVTPDVIVRRTREGWQASLNRDVMPRLRVNDMYADILRRNRGISGNLSGQLQEARWMIKNVQQRFETILRVSQAIVDRQKAFFSHGAVGMRPLVRREIADTLGLHESTVSRVTTQKYMLTPHGTFELSYFFGSHVATDSGGAASSTAIRALIRQLISAEDSRHPISDSRIAELLGEQGFVVARRTVAKYREALRIPSVSHRKTL